MPRILSNTKLLPTAKPRAGVTFFASSRQYPGSSFFILFRLFDEPVIARKPVGVGVVRAGRKVHPVVVARAGEHRKCRRVVGLCEQSLSLARYAGVRNKAVAVAADYSPLVRRERTA